MESRLIQAEAQYRFLVEQIPAITYTAALDIPGKLLYVSPQLSALGYSPEELTAQVGVLRSHIHPDDKQRAVDAFEQVRATGKPLRCEYRLFNRAGEVRWFLDEASLVYDEHGRPLLLQGILIDITQEKQVEEELLLHRRHIDDLVALRTTQLEKQVAVYKSANTSLSGELRARTQAEATLKQSADQLADLYHNAPCGYHSLDADGVFVHINDTELKWHELTREEVVGKMRFVDQLTAESRKTFQESYPHFRMSGWIRDLELEMVRKDGTKLTVLLSANAIKDADGHFVKSRSTLFDISDRKRAG
jgi:PAS domain S-box-containing protein